MKRSALSALGQRTAPPAISWLMKMALERPNLISLAAGFTDNASLPVKETTELLERILRQPKLARASLQYGSTAGDPLLRKFTAAQLQKMDGGKKVALYAPESMIITHGSQQLLYLLTESLCDSGDIVLVEGPTYFVYLGILQSHGISAYSIPMETDGIKLEALRHTLDKLKREGLLPRLKMLYLVSYFQNPSGITTSFAKKKAALKILREYEKDAGHPIYLLEDAAYRELRFDGPDEPSALSAPGGSDRVVYAGTFSKPFATGIRVGYGRLPEPLLSVVTRVKGNHDFGTSHLLQQILLEALRSGLYHEHLTRLQGRYQAKAKIMTDAIAQHFPPWVQWDQPRGGLYVWARLPRRHKTGPESSIFKSALQHDVLYVPGQLCYPPQPGRRAPDGEMRISFGSAPERNIREGIARLGEVLRSGAPARHRKTATVARGGKIAA